MANFQYNIPDDVKKGIALHFEADVPICDLDITSPQKSRLTRVKAIYMAWLQNPYLNVYEMSRSMLKADEKKYKDKGDLVTAAKKDEAWFRWIEKNYLELPSRKELQYKGLNTAQRMIQAGMESGNWLTVNDGLKQQYKYGGLDREEEDPNRISEASYTELIPTTDVTKVDPNRKRISAERRLELAAKWGAHIDEHGLVVDKDGKAVVSQQTPDGEPTGTVTKGQEKYAATYGTLMEVESETKEDE